MRITERKLRKIIRESISGEINTIEAAKEAFIKSPRACIYEDGVEIMHIREMPGFIKEVRALYNRSGKLLSWNIVYRAAGGTLESLSPSPISNSQNEANEAKTQYIEANLAWGCWLYQINASTGDVAQMALRAGDLR
jgi:hypothetical protein